jgi:hypothetical protein
LGESTEILDYNATKIKIIRHEVAIVVEGKTTTRISAIIGHSLSPNPITDRLCPIFKVKEKCLMRSFMLISIPKERYDHMVESYSNVVAENERLKDKLKKIERLVKEYEGTGKH